MTDVDAFVAEVVPAGVSGELGYVVGLEHSRAAVGEEPMRSYTLPVTTVLRREHGAWRVVHRHGDELPINAGSHP